MCRLATKIRAQSPNNAHQYHCSPTRHRPNVSSDDRKAEEKKVEKHSEQPKAEAAVKRNADVHSTNPSSQANGNVVSAENAKIRSPKVETSDKLLKGDASEKNQSPDRKDPMSPKVDPSEKKTQSSIENGDMRKGDDSRAFVS